MNKILTAENLLNSKLYSKTLKKYLPKTYKAVNNIMIEFAKLHVEAALKAASEKAYYRDFNDYICRSEENKKSILTAYPIDNIK